jgi:hypothetical protein
MKRSRLLTARWTAVACLAMLAWPVGVEGQPTKKEEAPGVLYSNVSGVVGPIWVSAAELTRGGGGIRWGLLAKNQAEDWQRTLRLLPRLETKGTGIHEVAEENCKVFSNDLTWPSVHEPIRSDLLALVRTSKEVFAGTVVAHTPGFLAGSLATVLTVEVTDGLRFEPPAQARSVLYVAYPQAHFVMGGLVFCGNHLKGGHLPEVGSRILVLSHYPPADTDNSLLRVSEPEVFSAFDGSNLFLPPDLKYSVALKGVSSFNELLETVRHLLAEPPELRTKSGQANDGGSR